VSVLLDRPAALVRSVHRARRRRVRRTVAALVVAVLAMFLVDVLLGTYTVTIPDFLRILGGTEIPGASFIVMENKLPRAVVGLLAGAAFGVSGAVCQTLLRNPLASPDVIGVTSGASAAAVLGIVVLGVRGHGVSWLALAGGLLVALTLHVMARGGGASGNRLVLVGIGCAALLQAVTSYLLTRSDIRTTSEVMVWLKGSLNDSTWERAAHLLLAIGLLLPVAARLAHGLRRLELGDDAAAGLGVPVTRVRLGLLLLAVALAAVATAAAGPVAFVAFLSGPIARRLLGGAVSLPAAGLVGALVVLAAEFVAANLVPGAVLPVGVVTGALGAPFLLWLLVTGSRVGRGG
jgi:iron complex transport system permease protein